MNYPFNKEDSDSAHWVAPAQNARLQARQHAQAGQTFFSREQWAQAAACFLEAIRLAPDDAYYHWAAAMSFWGEGQTEKAGSYLQTTVQINPKLAVAQSWLGQWLLQHGLIEDALTASQKAIEAEPDNPLFMEGRAWVLEAAGELDQSWQLVEKLVARNQITPSFARLYGRLAPRYGRHEEALRVILKILENNINPREFSLYLTAANLLDRAGRYDDAFSYVMRGNQMGRPVGYDPSEQTKWTDARIEYFTRERLASLPRATLHNDKPVLILGMPRSGTSLVEQILASHPEVHGAGELDFMHQMFMGALGMLRANITDYPRCLDNLTADQADGLAQIYIKPLVALKPEAKRITDKMPMNFLYLGMAPSLLPGIKIIHCQRDPMDTCLSCFMTSFNTGHKFKYDLTNLGIFYRDYHRLMEHWNKVLDIPILNVNYEELVKDTENQARRMVQFVDLPWDDRCLRFYQTKRAVVTSSVLQVREPIYDSSVGKWRNYEKHLGPLKKAIEGS